MSDDHKTRRRRRIEIAMAHARIGSQKEMAKKLGVSQPTLHEVISGERPGASLIAKISKETGVETEWIQFGFVRSAPMFALPYYIDAGLGDTVDEPLTPRIILASDNAEVRLLRDVSEGRIHPSFSAHVPAALRQEAPVTTAFLDSHAPGSVEAAAQIAALQRENADLRARLEQIAAIAAPPVPAPAARGRGAFQFPVPHASHRDDAAKQRAASGDAPYRDDVSPAIPAGGAPTPHPAID